MEDYTYHFNHSHRVLGAHMLEICPTIAAEQPTAEIHPLSIGGKSDPVRLVFTAPDGPAIVASIVQTGNRFRMISNEVDVVAPDRPFAACRWPARYGCRGRICKSPPRPGSTRRCTSHRLQPVA